MKRWLRNLNTARRLRLLLQHGWCPRCNSSPPSLRCSVCLGSRDYGPRITPVDRARWAQRYVSDRSWQ